MIVATQISGRGRDAVGTRSDAVGELTDAVGTGPGRALTAAAQLEVYAASLLLPMPRQLPADWAVAAVQFDEAEYRGPFLTAGAEYLVEPLNLWADRSVRDIVLCWGSQAKKTGLLMAGVCWSVIHDPAGIFWVMPTAPLARSFSRTRLQPMLRRTMPDLVPSGSRRHDFSSMEMTVGAAGLKLVGSNSPGPLSSTPSRRVILDEVDKFDEGGRGEADAVNLSEQRCKNAANPQRWKTSTPTLVSGLIWQELLKGDQRRCYLPCPHCGKFVLLAWSRQYTVFKLTGDEAFAKWDAEAKKPDGTWDDQRVEQSARFECPHCGGHIRDGHKKAMLAGHQWRATATAPPHFRSYHLPSLYASTPETGCGRLAVKFLQAKQSLRGLQGFINGDLAEPYQSQDTLGERIELVTSKLEVTAEWKTMITVDCQQAAPHFWYVVRSWNSVSSHGIAGGSCDTWEELRTIQQTHKIPDVGVFVDSGFGARSDADVYRNCARFSEMVAGAARSIAIGWMPTKGMPGRKRWKDRDGVLVPWYLADIDPFMGTSQAGAVVMNLLEFSGDYFKDVLQNLRASKGGNSWSVSDGLNSETYWRHMDAEIKIAKMNKFSGRTNHVWEMRSQHWPNHLLDCEVLQIVAAAFFSILKIDSN